MIDKFKIGARIREIRKHLKYKQKVFAKELGVTGGYLSEIEIGRKSPGLELIVSLVNKYNANIMYLFYGEGGFFRKPDEDKIEDGPVIPGDDWSNTDRLVWLIKHIPLIRYAMLEYYLSYTFDKKRLIESEIEKYQENLKKEKEKEEAT